MTIKIKRPGEGTHDGFGVLRPGLPPRGDAKRLAGLFQFDPVFLISAIYRSAPSDVKSSVYEGSLLTWQAAGTLEPVCLAQTGNTIRWRGGSPPIVEWLIKSWREANPEFASETDSEVTRHLLLLGDAGDDVAADLTTYISGLEADNDGNIRIA